MHHLVSRHRGSHGVGEGVSRARFAQHLYLIQAGHGWRPYKGLSKLYPRLGRRALQPTFQMQSGIKTIGPYRPRSAEAYHH